VNVLVALADRAHEHHGLAKTWFNVSPPRPWALCAFTEAGFLRVSTAPRPVQIAMNEAKAVLEQ
jgi:predicted nucleic acid-binding protein